MKSLNIDLSDQYQYSAVFIGLQLDKWLKLDLKRYSQNLKDLICSQVLLKVKPHVFLNKLTLSHIKSCDEQ